MDDFTFVDVTDGRSGKIKTLPARRTIRAHASRYRWKPASLEESHRQARSVEESCKKAIRSSQLQNLTRRISAGKSASAHCKTNTTSDGLEGTIDELAKVKRSMEGSSQKRIGGTDMILRRVSGADAGFCPPNASRIDMMDRQLFSHYSAEFRVMLCDPIQPVVPAEQSICCYLAIHEGCAALLHSVCATVAAHEAIVGGEIPEPRAFFKPESHLSQRQIRAIKHTGAAVRLLNRQLAQQASTDTLSASLVLSVTVLPAAEAILGNDGAQALGAHHRGLTNIVHSFGGLIRLPPPVTTQVRMVDIKSAMVQGVMPSFKLSSSMIQRLEWLSSRPSPISSSEVRLRKFKYFNHIDVRLQKCMRCVEHLTCFVGSFESFQRDTMCTLDDFIALEHQLLSLKVPTDADSLEECVRIALLLYINTALWRTPLYFNWIMTLRRQLKDALLIIDRRRSNQQEDELILWIIFLGRFASSTGAEEERAWWDTELRQAASQLNFRLWPDAKAELQSFYYIEAVYDKPYEQMWNSIIFGKMYTQQSELTRHPCSAFSQNP